MPYARKKARQKFGVWPFLKAIWIKGVVNMIRKNTNIPTKFGARAEFERLRAVAVHEPGIEAYFASIDPEPHVFSGTFNYEMAKMEHRRLVKILIKYGIDVFYVRDFAIEHPDFRKIFVDSLSYLFTDKDGNLVDVDEGYISKLIENVDDYSKFQSALLNFVIERKGFDKNALDADGANRSGFPMYHIKKIISNLYFMRDQQILTDKGFVLGNMRWPIRNCEPKITKMAFESMKAPIVYEVTDDDVDFGDNKERGLEGGDYIPAGDFCLFGSARTSLRAVCSIMDAGAVGFDNVVYVHSPVEEYEKFMDEIGKKDNTEMRLMHLDTWFNIIGNDLVFTSTRLAKAAKVEIFGKDENYRKVGESTLYDYLTDRKFEICEMDIEMQPEACNFLTLDNKVILPYNCNKELQIGNWLEMRKRLKDYGVTVINDKGSDWGINIENLAEGYGGIHCMTCPLLRE